MDDQILPILTFLSTNIFAKESKSWNLQCEYFINYRDVDEMWQLEPKFRINFLKQGKKNSIGLFKIKIYRNWI